MVTIVQPVHVWNGHSCPLPLTLILTLILTLTSSRYTRRGCPILARSLRKSRNLGSLRRSPWKLLSAMASTNTACTIVEERRLQRRVSQDKRVEQAFRPASNTYKIQGLQPLT